jgi:hypothetical protein
MNGPNASSAFYAELAGSGGVESRKTAGRVTPGAMSALSAYKTAANENRRKNQNVD